MPEFKICEACFGAGFIFAPVGHAEGPIIQGPCPKCEASRIPQFEVVITALAKEVGELRVDAAIHEHFHRACTSGFEMIAAAAEITLDAPEAMACEIAAAISNARFKRDALMKSVSVNWFPREIAQGKATPDLMAGFIWGTDRPELSGFVQSVREGELAVALFDGNAKLIYSEAEPNNIQVVVSADRKVLEFLIVLMGLNGKALNADIIKQVREYAAAQKKIA